MEYEAVIGLEVHVQLNTKTKLFSRSAYTYGQDANTLTDPVVLGLPGVLPVLNEEAVRKTIKAGLMLNCNIAQVCKWDRKNYFYPDLPKGYQLSQFDEPLCLGGSLEIEMEGSSRNVMGEHKTIELTRIHLEEDAGKSTHYGDYSLVDLNRAGAALMEIVTEPVLTSPDEVFAFLNSLKTHMQYVGVSDCDMEKGQMRCDANVSIRPKGETKLGTRVEIKNLNSISGVRNGVIYEIKRQSRMLDEGQTIIQETRRWDADEQVTISMRGKERAHDYRYFPDPDLMPVKVSEALRNEIGASLPERPFAKQARYQKELNLPYTVTSVLCPDVELAYYFESALEHHNSPKVIANLMINDLLRELAAVDQDGSLPLSECKVTPAQLAGLAQLVDGGKINKQVAQEVFIEMFKSGQDPQVIVKEKGLEQSSDTGELEQFCHEAIANDPDAVAKFKGGKDGAINALKGYVMKQTRGKANPQVVDETLRRLLS